jgi:hypothetical protein
MKHSILILLIFLSSCSVFNPSRERQVERAKDKIGRIVQKFPELKETERDTTLIPIILFDTLITVEERTVTQEKITKDTIRIETERAKLKLLVKKESIFVDLLVKADTIFKLDTVYALQIVESNVVNLEKDCQYCLKQYKSKIIFWTITIFLFIFALIIAYFVIKKLIRFNF